MADNQAPAGTPRQVHWIEGEPPIAPADAAAARERLDRGSAGFAGVGDGLALTVTVGPETFGLAAGGGGPLHHHPFAAVLGCSDARVPVELILGQTTDDLFVVRVAGNVPGSDCVGSMHYAMGALPSVRVVVLLGHTSCGAVTAAVDAMLNPRGYLDVVHDSQLRGIVDSLLAGVRLADVTLGEVYGEQVREHAGYRDALLSLSTLANAAISASVLARDLPKPVVMGLYDLGRRTVGIQGADGWRPGLVDAPTNDEELTALLLAAAGAMRV